MNIMQLTSMSFILLIPCQGNTNMLIHKKKKKTVVILSPKNSVWSYIYQHPVHMTGDITSIHSPSHALAETL